jgi:3-deoxy-manno-octulosonate cytidylyltransferase (CMP-KDO synthetase)
MSIIAIIPARYGSTRFPGKALALIKGKPMVQWVYERTKRSRLVDRVIIATDDERIPPARTGSPRLLKSSRASSWSTCRGTNR